jgi:hypothetical protein
VESNIENITCPLCQTEQVREFFQGKRRHYYQCHVCSLVFVPSWLFLPAEDEKKRYDLHQNSPEDLNYRRFLSRIFIPLQRCLTPGSSGLDFGSGPEPTLSMMFEEAGHSMTLFDYFYEQVPDPTHVCFFSRSTFTWLALQWNAELTFADSDVILFHKKPVSSSLQSVTEREGSE